jgi:microcystin-dependent protein
MNIPKGWELCNGQRLYKAEYLDLYEAIGNQYANQTKELASEKFRLPDLRGKIPVHPEY